MKKRLTLFLLLLICAVSSFGAAPKNVPTLYDREAALQCAYYYSDAKWWNCAEYVSRCLRSGGLEISADGCTTLNSLLSQYPNVEIIHVDWETSEYVYLGDLAEKLVPGDVAIYYCQHCADGFPYVHTLLYSGVDSGGYMKGFSHNPWEDSTVRYWYPRTCYSCGYTMHDLYFYHFTEPDEGWTLDHGKRIYLGPNRTPVTGMMAWNGDSYYFDRDGLLCTGWQHIPGMLIFSRPDGKIIRYVSLVRNRAELSDAKARSLAISLHPQIAATPLYR